MIEKWEEPFGYAGGYTLDLYCDHKNEDHPYTSQFPGFSESFYGNNHTEAAREARAAGWTIHRDRTATCKHCSRELR
ncbi:hypothetical protein [Phaeobacter phage MD18]|nr:hypothetical protein [Phaeobacter phage MD18]